jgi:hypothetical protein
LNCKIVSDGAFLLDVVGCRYTTSCEDRKVNGHSHDIEKTDASLCCFTNSSLPEISCGKYRLVICHLKVTATDFLQTVCRAEKMVLKPTLF